MIYFKQININTNQY